MTQAVAHLLNEAERLSPDERAELTDRLLESLVRNVPPEVERAQIEAVRRRVAEVESGEVSLVSGESALGQVRRLVDETRRAG